MNYFPMIFLVAGLFGMAAGASVIFTALKCRNWPRVTGKVISCGITTDHTSHGDNDGGNRSAPFVTYVYSVAGQEYHGKRISVGDYGGTLRYARKAIGKYDPNMDVEVFYDPKDPGECVLDTKFSLSVMLPFAVGALFFTFSLLFLFGVIGKKG